jgi:hypothetical protein
MPLVGYWHSRPAITTTNLPDVPPEVRSSSVGLPTYQIRWQAVPAHSYYTGAHAAMWLHTLPSPLV